MFYPNNRCEIRRKGSARNLYGKVSMGAPVPARCSVVKLISLDEKTPVRADSSASRGAGMESKFFCVLLFPIDLYPLRGDVVVMNGDSYEIVQSHLRFTASGEAHHYEVEGTTWQG